MTSNVVNDDGEHLADRPWVVLEVGDLRVGVIGVITAKLPYITTSARLGPWNVLPVVPSVARHVSEVARQSDLVVVLGHLVDEEEDAVLAEIPGVPVVISGHGHDGLEAPKVMDGRVCVRFTATRAFLPSWSARS